MFEKLTKKQKIAGGAIIAIVLLVVGIIGFFLSQEEKAGTVLDLNQLIAQEENELVENKVNEQDTEEQVEENKSKIVVHVTGEVKNTGVYTLEEGARIADAIKSAGGATKEADLNEINLAYELQDGEQIYVPNKKDKEKNTEKAYITSESGQNVIKTQNTSGATNNKGGNQKVNINEATQNELETLPGIGPSIASRIIEYRNQNGKFQKIEDLQNVKGIGESKFANVKEYVTVK